MQLISLYMTSFITSKSLVLVIKDSLIRMNLKVEQCWVSAMMEQAQ